MTATKNHFGWRTGGRAGGRADGRTGGWLRRLYDKSVKDLSAGQFCFPLCPDPVFVSVSDRLFTATVLATGIAALHVCFLRVNLPFYTQITREIHSRNTRVKKIHEKIHANFRKLRVKFYTSCNCVCKILHAWFCV